MRTVTAPFPLPLSLRVLRASVVKSVLVAALIAATALVALGRPGTTAAHPLGNIFGDSSSSRPYLHTIFRK